MKKYLILSIALSLILVFSGSTIAQESDFLNLDLENREMVVGLDYPAVGWANYENGAIAGYKGVNIALGYTDKRYMEPGIKQGEINTFYSFGTVAVYNPYVEVGVDYPFALNTATGEFWTATFAGGAAYIFDAGVTPVPRLGVSYHF